MGDDSTNHQQEIKELAWAINDALTSYINVHNLIFNEAATFKSFLKNLFGRGVPMSDLLKESEQLLPLWNSIHEEIADFHRSTYSSLSEGERTYFDILLRYAEAVRETVIALVNRQRLWNVGSKGGPANPMTWNAYTKSHNIYEQSIELYMKIGLELNAANKIIFN